ncbi:kinase-like protein [Trichoderma citrinoviride]|uniref:Autophagy-related protein 1 n=1 Tax=Trichoderma citrinoviride TaxID=58853 RepID=A0A2T4BJ33_9HYPO|nr:kinase-like protein [Trichoderma citrinoviride]PTB69327.1 kinase-like protein [Trichoderma citrinoviride]
MTTPSTQDDANTWEPTILQVLDQFVPICKRFTIWAKELASPEKPLTELASEQVQNLCTSVARLSTQATAPGRGPAEDEQLWQILTRCKTQLFETVSLLSFVAKAEQSGQEGALNELYARRFILDSGTYTNTPPSHGRVDGMIRLGLDLKGIIATLASDTPAALLTPATTSKRFQQQEPKISDLLHGASKLVSPRHVHSYESIAETPYYVLDPAGEAYSGSYGTVQKVVHKHTGEHLAMKTFHSVFSNKQRKKILREIGILEVCDHQNIVRFIQAFSTEDDDQAIRLVMSPWAPYTLLRFLHSSDVKRKNRCPWFQPDSAPSSCHIYRIMYELADAVGWLHGHGIKHKDIKPENILLHQEASEFPTALVTDVGVSKIYKPGGSTNFIKSTYVYLAPEQHAMKESSLRSDVWQLGCCFAEVLAVAKSGFSGYVKLYESYNREEEDCACSIALEYPSFSAAFGALCMRGSAAQKKAYAVTVGMLELEPQDRPTIDLVKGVLSEMPGVTKKA